MIRPRGGTARRGGDGQDGDLASQPESVGAQLRQARDERGLDLLAVHDRLGRPITQLEALETGDMAALGDEALAISTLRRYATFLGLDGDALADQFVLERASASVEPATRSTAAVTSVVAAVTTSPDHLRAFTETGEVPQVGGRVTSAAGTSGNYDYAVVSRATDRHVSRGPAVRSAQGSPPGGPGPSPDACAGGISKVVTWVAAILVLIVAVGFVLVAVRPRMLANAHILRTAPAGSVAAGGHGSDLASGTAPPRATRPCRCNRRDSPRRARRTPWPLRRSTWSWPLRVPAGYRSPVPRRRSRSSVGSSRRPRC